MMGYEQFFGLNDAPFSLAPNPRYLFDSASHSAALEQLTYAIGRREPLIVMTGEIGTGKTLLCRTVLQRLDRKTFVSVINDPHLQPDDLLIQMLQDFGIMSSDRSVVSTTSRHDLVHALEDFLSSLVVLNAHAVVIIDEAQHVKPEVLEQVRLLSNIDAPGGTMLQIILAGQLDLEALLGRPELRQIQQRVSRRIRLEPLKKGELRSYIDHRLAVSRAAGSKMPGAGELARALVEWDGVDSGGTFTPEAVDAVWRWSSGLPRVVNLLCDRALEAACAQSVRTIDGTLVESAAQALGLRAEAAVAAAEPIWEATAVDVPQPVAAVFEPEPAVPSMWTRRIAVAVALLVVAVAIAWVMTRDTTKTVAAPVAAPAQRPAASTPPAAAPAATPAATAAPPATAASPSTAGATPAGRPSATSPSSAASPGATPPASTATPTPAAAAAERTTALSGRAAAPPGVSAFEIVVASFRTEPRAAAVAAQVAAAGLTVRRRDVGGWLQVLAGPYPTREEADAARQRLERVGLTGTQVMPTER